MASSVFLARLIGPVLLVVGLTVFVHQQQFRDLVAEVLASRALMFISGFILMPAGLAMVLTHNVWTADWRVLITILGWLTAVGGALRLLAPQILLSTADGYLKRPQLTAMSAALWVLLGLVLCFFGYLH